MKRSVLVPLVASLLASVSYCTGQPSEPKGVIGVKKGDVLLELQQIPLDSFGVLAEVPDLEQWSAWLVRLTNRRRLPIMVQGGPHLVSSTSPRSLLTTIAADKLDYMNWRLRDGEDKIVGQVAHSVKTGVRQDGSAIMTPVFDHLLESKGPLASPEYALHAAPEPMWEAKAEWLETLFTHGGQTRGKWRPPRQVLRGPDTTQPPVMPSPALWPGETTWGYLIFYRSIRTRSQVIIPKAYFGTGVTWARVVNPELANELTRPQDEEPPPIPEDAIQRWLREHGYVTEDGEK